MTTLQQARNMMRIAGLSTTLLAGSAGLAFAQSASFSGENSTTGASSENTNDNMINSSNSMNHAHMTDVFNGINARANTGGNMSNRNTEVGRVSSGAIRVMDNVSTEANNGHMSMSGMSKDMSLNTNFDNATTGANSENRNSVNVTNRNSTDMRSTANVRNTSNLNLNSGGNTANENTTLGGQSSGNVLGNVQFSNKANPGGAMTSGTGESSSVSVSGGNSRTGFNSMNTNRTIVDNSVTTTVRNDANINNSIDINANTGGNDVSRNTTVGGVNSGDVSLDLTTSNMAN